jgi:hypothetical protein
VEAPGFSPLNSGLQRKAGLSRGKVELSSEHCGRNVLYQGMTLVTP